MQLHLGDCLEFMRTLPAGSVDAVVTDPPYGVGFGYDAFDDNRETHRLWIRPIVEEMRRIASLVIITPGITHLYGYPEPDWTMCYFKPGSTRRNGFGSFNEWEPILIYGKPNSYTDAKRFPDCVNHSPTGIGHPCPKPLNAIRWMVEMTPSGATVLDPFMGSGTTGVACVQTGRNFIGCEIDAGYFEIAQRRIALAQQQPMLPGINDPVPTPEQLSLV